MQLRRPNDDELFLMHEAYFEYNENLWIEFVVKPGTPDRRFRLTVEDADLTSGRHAFFKAIRKFINSYEGDIFRAAEAADRIARWKKVDAPGSLSILAACVLIASSMTSGNGFSAAAFYPLFNREILEIDEDSAPKRFDKLRDKWVELARLIKAKKLGELMIPKTPARVPIRNRININYPLSQCLFRKIDIEKLAPQLAEWAVNGLRGDEAFSKLMLHVRYFRNVSAALMTSLEASDKDPDLREAYCDALDDLIADATRHVTVALRLASPKLNADPAGIARLRLERVRQYDAPNVYDIVLEVQSEESWTLADFRCETTDVVGNTIVEINGRRYRYLGADPQVFFEDELQIVTGRGNKLPSFAHLIIVASSKYETELTAFAESIRERDSDVRDPIMSLRLLERFASLCAVRFTFSSKGVAATGLPGCLSRYDIAAPATLSEIGGLKVGGDYLVGCPPRLELSWDAVDGDVPALQCDAMDLSARQLADRIEVDLSAFASEIGLHYVTSSDSRLKLTFRIVDPDPIVRQVPDSGAYNAMYFGPQFLRFLTQAGDIRKARHQAESHDSNSAFMIGAWVVSGDGR